MLTKIKMIISVFKRGQLEQKYRESLQWIWYSILSQWCKLAEFQKVAASFNLSCWEALIWTGLYTWGKKLLCRLFLLHGNFFVVSSEDLFCFFNNITVCILGWSCSSGGECSPERKSKVQSAVSPCLPAPEGLFRLKCITIHLCTAMSRGHVWLAYIWGVSSFRKIHFYWTQKKNYWQ